jgi:bifunctional enzyme CysN/CysC
MTAKRAAVRPIETAAAGQAPGTRAAVRIVIVGHVDHGKSTLIGRLMHDTGSLPDGKLEAIKGMSERRGMPFEWSFLLDALQAERDQGITIDTSQIRFRTPNRDVLLIDAPGHVEFLKNMVTGAAQADAALLVIDAAEGVREQSRRHGFLLHLLGVGNVTVIVNKMDKVAYSEAEFRRIETEFRAYLASLGVTAGAFIPVAAREGDMIVERGAHLGWYTGPTVVSAIDTLEPARPPQDLALRIPVQDVYKFDDRRIVAGRVEAGRINVGDEIVFLPSGKTAHVQSLETWPPRPAGAEIRTLDAGASAALVLDRQLFVERGEIATSALSRPPVARVLKARIFWLGEEALIAGSRLTMKLATAEMQAAVTSIEAVVDTGTLSATASSKVERNQVADLTLTLNRPVAADTHEMNPRTGRFVLETGGRIAGGGIVLALSAEAQRRSSPNVTPVLSAVTSNERAARMRHTGQVVWLTGLPSSGKSTLGRALERAIFDRGGFAVLLDGDTLRTGLNGDLGFSPTDRSENIRRTAEVASFLARQGQIAIVALVSPSAYDRALARDIGGPLFFEVHVKASVDTCAARDPKGLYAKARAGQIQGFTGVSAPYDEPAHPEIVLETDADTVAGCIGRLMAELGVKEVLQAGG